MKLIMRWWRRATYRDRHGYQARSQYEVRRSESWMDADEEVMDRYFRAGKVRRSESWMDADEEVMDRYFRAGTRSD